MAQTAHKNLIIARSTMILEPTHDGIDELMRMIPGDVGHNFAVHLYGKNESTCHPENINKVCTQCPYFKKTNDPDNQLKEKIINSGRGKILNLTELKVIAREYSICPKLVSHILAMADTPKIIAATIAYLGTGPALDILEKIPVDEINIDEADTLFETLQNTQQKSLILMEPRQRKAHTIREICNQDCKTCLPHLADHPKIKPSTGRCEDLQGIGDKNNIKELLENAISTVKRGVEKEIIKPIFDFSKAHEAVAAIFNTIPSCEADTSTREFLDDIEEKNKSSLIRITGYEDEEGGEFAIPINVSRISFVDIKDSDHDPDLSDDRMRIAQMKRIVQVNPEVKLDGGFESALKTFLQLVDFIDNSSGQIYFFPERKPFEKPHGNPHCRLSLRYLNKAHYERVLRFLKGRSNLLSGTLLDASLIAANLLIEPEDVNLQSIDGLFHRSALIIVNNDTENLPPWAFEEIYVKVQSHLEDISILHFSTNTNNANSFYKGLNENPKIKGRFKLESQHKDTFEHDFSVHASSVDQRKALITIDKLRSSSSRGINRTEYSLCTVDGNGISNWSNRAPLFMEARKIQPSIAMDALIQYEQTRTVVQALMRAPRSASPTVCFYSGNLHAMAFPKFLRNRILTTPSLVSLYLAEANVPKSTSKFQIKIDAIVHTMVKFLKNEPLKIVARTLLPVDPISSEWPGRRGTYEKRMEHIKQKLDEKGYVDRTADKMGERPQWNAFLDWLVEEGFFETKNSEGKQKLILKKR